MRITAICADYGGCGFYRIILPYDVLSRRGHQVHVNHRLNWNTMTMEPVPPADILIIQRPGNLGMIPHVFEMSQRHSIALVAELDDMLWNIPAWNPAFQMWRTPKAMESTKPINNLLLLRKYLSVCDAITVSTLALAEETKALFPKKPVYVLPNHIACGDWPNVDHQQRWGAAHTVTLGWGGSDTHRSDLMTIAGIPAQIAARHDHVRMYFFGFPATPRLLLAKGVPEAKITTHAWVPVPDYPQQVARVDIGLAPVEDNRFNSCKSDIKAVEYGACAIPTVATDSVTYRSFVRHGDNGFLCRTTRDWLQALTTLATNHSQRIAMGVQARKDAEARDIEHGIHLWDEALTDILERKRHVPTALLQR